MAPPGYGPPPPCRPPGPPTSTLAIVALVCAAIAPPVGLLLAWLAVRETHPVTGTRSGRELATAALWLNAVLTGVIALAIGMFVLQLAGMALSMLPVLLGASGI